jgi:hypothetical protein
MILRNGCTLKLFHKHYRIMKKSNEAYQVLDCVDDFNFMDGRINWSAVRLVYKTNPIRRDFPGTVTVL